MVGGSNTDLGRSLSLHRGKFASGGCGWLWYFGGLLLLGGIVQLAEVVGLKTPKPKWEFSMLPTLRSELKGWQNRIS